MGTVENDTARYYQEIDAHERKYDYIEQQTKILYKKWMAELQETDYIEYLDYHMDDIRDIMETKGFLSPDVVVDMLAYEEVCEQYEKQKWD